MNSVDFAKMYIYILINPVGFAKTWNQVFMKCVNLEGRKTERLRTKFRAKPLCILRTSGVKT
jgi:hypothetical protein